MIPALTKDGRSFKGAALYYLHDKRQAGEAERLTSDRVAWTQTVNLPTDDADKAWRMMATTAMKGEELKAAAGVKATGRKMVKPVFAYSLSWDQSEQPTKEEQLEAARSSLEALGLTEFQALIVSHKDTDHPHVHVIVNKVHPAEGRVPDTLGNSKLKLSDWAEDYERKRGKILCPKRAENNARRKKGEYVRAPRIPRPTYEFNRGVANDSISTTLVRTDQKQRDAALAKTGRDMHDSHRKQWEALNRAYREAKDRIYRQADERKTARGDEIKAAFKPQWGELFKQQRDARRAFDRREESLLGTLFNVFTGTREARRSGADALTMLVVVVLLLTKAERERAFVQEQERERQAMARAVSDATRQGRGAVRQAAKADADRLRETYLTQCAQLRDVQQQQQAALKLAWAKRNADRKAAFAPIRDRAAKWQRLAELGQKGRGQGLAPAMYRGRELRRE